AVRAIAGVNAVALTSELPVGDVARTVVQARGDSRAHEVDQLSISPDFFSILKVPLTDGRGFDDQDDNRHAPVVMVSASLARQLFEADSAVSRVVTIGIGPTQFAATVIGVVGDLRLNPAVGQARPLVFRPLTQAAPATAALVIDPVAGAI